MEGLRLRRRDALGIGALTLLLFVVLGAVTWRFVDNDGVAYLSVAAHYAEARWAQAVNGYWSPLLSWITAPLLAAGLEPVPAGRAAQAVATGVALFGLARIVVALGGRRSAVLATLTVAVPVLVAESLRRVSPDLLAAGLALVALAALFEAFDARGRPVSAGRGRVGVTVAVVAAAAALAKLFVGLLLAAVGAIAVVAAVRLDAGPRARRAGVTVAAAPLAALALWSVVLSVDAGRVLLSSSLEYHVLALATPGEAAPSADGLAPPPHPSSITPWEEPLRSAGTPGVAVGAATDGEPVEPSLPEPLTESVRERAESAVRRLYAFAVRWPALSAAAAATLALALVVLRGRGGPSRGALGVAGLWTVAVLVTWVEPRYLYTPFLLVLAAAIVAVRAPPRRLLAGAVTVSVLLAVGVHASLGVLRDDLDDVLAAAAAIEGAYGTPVRVATLGPGKVATHICVHLEGCASYGRIRPTTPPSTARRDLARFGVDALVVDVSREGSELPAALGLREIAPAEGRWRVFDVSGGGRGVAVAEIRAPATTSVEEP